VIPKPQTRKQAFEEGLEFAKQQKDGAMCVLLLTCLQAAYTRLGDAFKASHCVQQSQEHFPEAQCRYLAHGLEAKVKSGHLTVQMHDAFTVRFGHLTVQMHDAFMDARA